MGNYVSENTKITDSEKKQLDHGSVQKTVNSQERQTLLLAGILFGSLLISFVILLLCLPDDTTWATVVKVLLIVASVLMVLFYALMLVAFLVIKPKEAYYVFEDTVTAVSPNDRVEKSAGIEIREHALYFERCGRVAVAFDQTYTANVGDTFYIVVYRRDPKTVVNIYNAKEYKLEDIKNG